jgi:hypothetical protein
MLEAYGKAVSATSVQAIEEAIYGHLCELDAVFDRIENDKDFPEAMRHDLQVLRYFRAQYGKDAVSASQN